MQSIIHILSSLKLGGAERLTVELAKTQKSRGHSVKIYSLSANDDFLVDEVLASDIPLQTTDPSTSRLKKYKNIADQIKKFDVVHIHSPRTLAYLTPLIPVLRNRTVIYTRHGLDPLNSLKWKLVHAIWKNHIKLTSFVTKAAYEVFVQTHKWSEDRLAVITNGVRVPSAESKVGQLPIRFGSVGRMVRLKRQDLLIDAASNLSSKQAIGSCFELHFFGSGPEADSLKQKAQCLGKDGVIFHGDVSDVDSIYENLDVLVVCSETEGLSMVIIEAMARGIPTIASDVGGNPTLVSNEETGILIPFGDISALYDAMTAFVSDPRLLTQLGTKARERIESGYSIEHTCSEYSRHYQS